MINKTPPVTTPSTLSPAQQAKFQKAASDFESMAINQLLAPIFNTVDQSKSMFGGGEGEAAWKPMMVTAIAKQMTANGGLGLAQPIMQQMIRMQEHAK